MRRADRRRPTAVRAMAVIALLAGIGASPAQDATNASRWAAMSSTAQAEWQQRRLAWDALPQHERDDRRARYAAWRALAQAMALHEPRPSDKHKEVLYIGPYVHANPK